MSATKVPITYDHGVPSQGDIMIWNGQKFENKPNIYLTQFFKEFTNADSSGKYYSLGIIYNGTGFSAEIESVSSRADIAGTTFKIYKRAFGSSTYTQIMPASGLSYITVSTSGNHNATDCPISLSSGDEILINIITKTFTSMFVSVNIKHKRA